MSGSELPIELNNTQGITKKGYQKTIVIYALAISAVIGTIGQSVIRGHNALRNEWDIEKYREQIPPGEILSIKKLLQHIELTVRISNGREYKVKCPLGNGRRVEECSIYPV